MHWYYGAVFFFVGVALLFGWFWQNRGKEVADQKEAERYDDES